jgi:hypothetical protein
VAALNALPRFMQQRQLQQPSVPLCVADRPGPALACRQSKHMKCQLLVLSQACVERRGCHVSEATGSHFYCRAYGKQPWPVSRVRAPGLSHHIYTRHGEANMQPPTEGHLSLSDSACQPPQHARTGQQQHSETNTDTHMARDGLRACWAVLLLRGAVPQAEASCSAWNAGHFEGDGLDHPVIGRAIARGLLAGVVPAMQGLGWRGACINPCARGSLQYSISRFCVTLTRYSTAYMMQ